MTNCIGRTARLLLLGGLLLGGLGCGGERFTAHVDQMHTIQGLAADAITRLGDGAQSSMQISGLAQDPGVTVEGGVMYVARAYFSGVAGQFGVNAHGTLSDRALPPAVQAILQDASISRRERLAIVQAFLADLATDEEPSTSQPATNGG